MNIGIIDADLLDNGTRHPNLALMKISSHLKQLGNTVNLLKSYETDLFYNYDKIYLSKVFTFTKHPDLRSIHSNLIYGGTGFFQDGSDALPNEIEHIMPDYSLYNDFIAAKIAGGSPKSFTSDYTDFSIGFTTRGCFRKCSFCVNKRFDKATIHSPINEFFDVSRKKIALWDDNFLACSEWKSILHSLKETNKPFEFRQGLDIRLITDEIANELSSCKYNGDLTFAFDHINLKDIITSKICILQNHIASSKNLRFYILCGFHSQDMNDLISTLERIKVLMQLGCLPYIMRHELYLQSPFKAMYVQLARWCNQPSLLKKKSFRQFIEMQKDVQPGAYAMSIQFEKDYPEIAKKYFDLHFIPNK